ncbi:Protein of unknown function [Gryllus bimaculatus]|nr:Protein of unknown function [Gryllus bimaculatus]
MAGLSVNSLSSVLSHMVAPPIPHSSLQCVASAALLAFSTEKGNEVVAVVEAAMANLWAADV